MRQALWQFGPFTLYRRTGWAGRIGLLLVILSSLMLVTACGPIDEAIMLIPLIAAAAESAVGILVAFGVGIDPTVVEAIQKWAGETVTSLRTVVGPLLDELKQATDANRGSILAQINAAVGVIISSLTEILPTIHISDAGLAGKITAIFEAVAAQLQAILNLVAGAQNKSLKHSELKKLVQAVKSPDEFREHFNGLVSQDFGSRFEI